MHQDFPLAAEANDVPDNEEVAGQVEFFDQVQLTLDLSPGPLTKVGSGAAIALLKSFQSALPQERHHGLAFRNRVFWEFIAKIAELELEALGKFDRIGEGFRQIGEELLHFLGRFHVPFGIAGEQPARRGQRAMMAQGGEDVAEFALLCGRIADAIGRKQRKLKRTGNLNGSPVARFFFPMEMPLQFDVDIFGTENPNQSLETTARFLRSTLGESGS